MNSSKTDLFWHITVLSNFARAYNKYTREYSKAAIPESTYPDRFYLLDKDELEVGIRKANALLVKLALPGNRLIALGTQVSADQLKPNPQTGLGQYVDSSTIRIDGIAFVEGSSPHVDLKPVAVEEVSALSFRLLRPELHDYQEIKPRTFSILPIARGCQASCPFCFSDASVSAEQEQAKINLEKLLHFATAARGRGAERFVITGGGEPGLVRHELLRQVISIGHTALEKVVLITNGHHLASREPSAMAAHLADYANSGLSVLALSRHHHDEDVSERLMSLRTDVASIARTWHTGREKWPQLRLRFTCVLQRGCIDSISAMEDYVDWASGHGVQEICFKELYVSTSVESVYHRYAANEWSHANQVPLSLVLEFAARHGFEEISWLPWGSPVLSGNWKQRPIQIAAYTEPSLFWERAHGIARSWNLMSDGRCLASLEDRTSEILLPTST